MQAREDFGSWIDWAGGTAQVQQLLGVSTRTVRHWRTAGTAPPWALRAIMLLATGIAPAPATTWHGWRFQADGPRWHLAGPDGSTWLPDDLYRFRDTHDHLRCLQEQLRPGAQLTWQAAGSGHRSTWPGGGAPSWRQLEDALRGVIEDVMRRA